METRTEAMIDSECLERYIKFEAEQVTEDDGAVTGTLLLTPTCLMFDPDLEAPLVISKGQDLYGLVCNLGEIVSVSVYQDSACLTGNLGDGNRQIFNPEQTKDDTEKMDTNDDTQSFDVTEEDDSKQESLNTSDLNRSLDALNELWLKTKQARIDAKRISWAVHSVVPECQRSHSGRAGPQVPSCEDDTKQYFLCVRLRRNKTALGASPNTSSMSIEDNLPFGNKDRREFWFTIPSNMAENIYYFLLQWLPDKYGMDTTASSFDETEPSMLLDPMGPEQSFVVLDSASEESLYSDANNLSSNSAKEWEFVTISELWRRIRPDRLIDVEPSIPEGAGSSKILDQAMIIQLLSILPARAQGYSWINCYDSTRDGSLLSTLYRNIKNELYDEMTPILIIIKDSKGGIFGAVASEPFLPYWKFQGTGACFLWRFSQADAGSSHRLQQFPWTGKNDYFLLAAKDYICMGASQGHYGLYLDADLLHGRTERCDTYANEILTGEDNDFRVDSVEVFGFRL